MDRTTIDRVMQNLRETAEAVEITLEEVLVFGSRAREDYRPDSDIDVILVSPDFEELRRYERPKRFFRHWDYETLPDPEFICLTPAEFEERKRMEPHIVRTAVEEGVSVL